MYDRKSQGTSRRRRFRLSVARNASMASPVTKSVGVGGNAIIAEIFRAFLTRCARASMPMTWEAPASSAAKLHRPSWQPRSRTRRPVKTAAFQPMIARQRALRRDREGIVSVVSRKRGKRSQNSCCIAPAMAPSVAAKIAGFDRYGRCHLRLKPGNSDQLNSRKNTASWSPRTVFIARARIAIVLRDRRQRYYVLSRLDLMSAASDPVPLLPLIIVPKRHADSRGWFSETFHDKRLRDLGIACTFVQDNQSRLEPKGYAARFSFPEPSGRAGKADQRIAWKNSRRRGRYTTQLADLWQICFGRSFKRQRQAAFCSDRIRARVRHAGRRSCRDV